MRRLGFLMLMAVLASPASAADYNNVMTYDWSGVYGGVHAGFIQADITVEGRGQTIEGQPIIDPLDLSYERDFDGFVGGALGGVNFQAGSFVFGLDMDFGGAVADGEGTAHGKGTVDGEDTVEDIRFQHGIDWAAHVRGRLGFALDRVLV